MTRVVVKALDRAGYPGWGLWDLLVQSSNVLTIQNQEQPVYPEGLMEACVGLSLLGGAHDQSHIPGA